MASSVTSTGSRHSTLLSVSRETQISRSRRRGLKEDRQIAIAICIQNVERLVVRRISFRNVALKTKGVRSAG
jgi:hypothetical protein